MILMIWLLITICIMIGIVCGGLLAASWLKKAIEYAIGRGLGW